MADKKADAGSVADIEWRDYPSIPSGVYRGYCRAAKLYWDRCYRRWVCIVLWDILNYDDKSLARLAQFFNLGAGQKPKATRRGNYFPAWVIANGGPPRRKDRLSPIIFANRYAKVKVVTTVKSAATPYSQVNRVIEWETGS